MIIYQDSVDDISPAQLTGFFVGWPNPPAPETHLQLLKQSSQVCLALDQKTEQVVGFISAVSDGVLSAYIPLLEVLPSFQGQGIGQRLVRRMLDRLSHLYMIDLLCDVELQSFYEKLGMNPATGMLIRNYENQEGVIASQE